MTASSQGRPFGSATYVEMGRGSALSSLMCGVEKIQMGASRIAIVGGTESFSTLPAEFSTSPVPYRCMAPVAIKKVYSPKIEECYEDAEFANRLIKKYGISAIELEKKTELSKIKGSYSAKKDIIPFGKAETDGNSGRNDIAASQNDFCKPQWTAPYCDSAAFLLIMSEKTAKEEGLAPIAHISSCALSGGAIENICETQADAAKKATDIANWKTNQISVVMHDDINAAYGMACDMELTKNGFQPQSLNVCSGMLGLGRADGAYGAIAILEAIRVLEQKHEKRAIISAGCDGGQGIAVAIELS